MTEAATKYDTKKPRWELMPSEALEELAKLYTLGAAKYGDNNWLKGMTWGRIFSALMRHAWKWWRGETYDQEDGQHHMIAVAWCALALFHYDLKKLGTDDRRKG